MEKLFYTLEEAAERLGKSTDHVRQMASSGQLEQFRDRDRLMFKKQQVDLIAGTGGEEEPIRLADSGELEPMGLASSGSSISLAGSGSPVASSSRKGKTGTPISPLSSRADAKESTGFSLLDTEGTDDSDANAVTRVSNSPSALVDPGDERGASGSGGLLDLTREADDTSLGAGLLDDVYGSETVASSTSAGNASEGASALSEAAEPSGPLFESAEGGDFAEDSAAVAVAPAAEAYDGAGSGLVGGLMLGSIVSLCIAAFTLVVSMVSSTGSVLKGLGNNYMILLGVCAGVPLLFGIVGWLLGKRK